MARQVRRLSDVKIRGLSEAGWYPDGDGLYLKVTASGTKSWVFRYRFGDRRRDMGLGKYPIITLAAARDHLETLRSQLKQGLDPLDEASSRKAEAMLRHSMTFDEAVQQYLDGMEDGWKNPKHRQQWRNTLATYASPVIGKTPVEAINTEDVLQILQPIWKEKAETASRLRGRIESVLDWCKVKKQREGENPAAWRGNLKHLLPARNKKRTVKHHPALPWKKIPEFITELRANKCLSARALELTILTVLRTSEVIGGKWSEFKDDYSVWVIPKERMKREIEHRVPLSPDATALIRELPRRPNSELVFPNAKANGSLSNMAMLELLRGMHPGLTVHGFRSSFRDWASAATAFPRDLAEISLAHSIGDETEAAYFREDLLEQRRQLMCAWAAYASGQPYGRRLILEEDQPGSVRR